MQPTFFIAFGFWSKNSPMLSGRKTAVTEKKK